MNFNVSARSADIRLPVHHFPGDESVSPSDYTGAIFAGYVSTTSTLYGAARGLGLDVDAETFERWKRIASATGSIDDFLDESENPHQARTRYIEELGLRGINLVGALEGGNRTRTSLELLRTSVEVMDPERHEQLVTSAIEIGRIAIEKSRCDDIDDYVSLLESEGLAAAHLATESATGYVSEQPGYETFVRWCESAIQAGTLLDHARDLRCDNRDGITQIEPTVRSVLTIARAARNPLRTIVSRELRPATYAGMASRMRFSALPTELTMSLMKNRGEWQENA